MKILAIDPGSEQSAYLIYEDQTQQILPDGKGIIPNLDLLTVVSEAKAAGVRLLAVEMVACYGMKVGQTIFDTAYWVGRFAQAAGLPFRLVYRMEEKMHLCRNSRAKDPNIRQALIDRFGPPGTKPKPGRTYGIKRDLWAALAVAVTAAETDGVVQQR